MGRSADTSRPEEAPGVQSSTRAFRQVSVQGRSGRPDRGPTDVTVRITTTNICGFDLYMKEGRTDFQTGRPSRSPPADRVPAARRLFHA